MSEPRFVEGEIRVIGDRSALMTFRHCAVVP